MCNASEGNLSGGSRLFRQPKVSEYVEPPNAPFVDHFVRSISRAYVQIDVRIERRRVHLIRQLDARQLDGR